MSSRSDRTLKQGAAMQVSSWRGRGGRPTRSASIHPGSCIKRTSVAVGWGDGAARVGQGVGSAAAPVRATSGRSAVPTVLLVTLERGPVCFIT